MGTRPDPESERPLHGPLQNFDLAAEGYTRLMHWRIFGHEGLAKTDVAFVVAR
jgi:hypothetical protein